MEEAVSWILVANASEAVVYALSLDKKANLQVVAEYAHPASRAKDLDLVSDKMGHYMGGHSVGEMAARGSFSEQTNPKDHEAEIFAKKLIDILNKARMSQRYQKLILVAPPHFLGLLNQNIPHPMRSMVNSEINKDYTKMKSEQLMGALRSSGLK